jgi:hyperosmotically inducible protein
MLRRMAAATVMMALTFSVPAVADDANYDMFRNVERQVQQYPFISIFDSVNIAVNDGVVELTGKVTMPFKRDGIGERVARVSGVTAVRNRITVLPVSQFDDDLRFRIARAIYSNPNFRGYGSRVNPPIHIIVERGRVTLEGVVNNNADRVIAQSIASSFGSFAFTNALKTVDEAKRELERL